MGKEIPSTLAEWRRACTPRRCRWVGKDAAGDWRVVTPDGADRPAGGQSEQDAIASVDYAWYDWQERLRETREVADARVASGN